MFKSPNIVVGLEIGTSKVCAAVGAIGSGGTLSIIGLGQSRSRGVRKGEIVNSSLAEEDVRNAIVEAEQMSNAEIRGVFLGVSGNHIQCVNNRGTHTIVTADREITELDVQDVMKNARAITLPMGHHVIHTIRQHFAVDDQAGIVDPRGRLGNRLDVEVHVIYGNLNRLQNPIRAVKNLQLEVEAPVFTGIASSLALLAGPQKEHGSLVIDLGGGTTEFVVYSGGVIRCAGVLGVGGDHVSNDIAVGLKIPLPRAEQLKISHGRAMLDDSFKGQVVTQTNEHGIEEKPVNLDHLQRIMVARLEEIFEIIHDDLDKAGVLDDLHAGVFLCGGGARTPMIQTLAERIFHLPAYIGKTSSISGLKSALDQPEFATAIGLVKYGSMQLRRPEINWSISGWLRGLVGPWLGNPARPSRPEPTPAAPPETAAEPTVREPVETVKDIR
jgi:cell division protein FtsA